MRSFHKYFMGWVADSLFVLYPNFISTKNTPSHPPEICPWIFHGTVLAGICFKNPFCIFNRCVHVQFDPLGLHTVNIFKCKFAPVQLNGTGNKPKTVTCQYNYTYSSLLIFSHCTCISLLIATLLTEKKQLVHKAHYAQYHTRFTTKSSFI